MTTPSATWIPPDEDRAPTIIEFDDPALELHVWPDLGIAVWIDSESGAPLRVVAMARA